MKSSAKIMLLGDIGVGKTSLANRFVFDRFDTDYKTTIGVNVLTHDVAMPAELGGGAMRLVLWDTDGDFGQTLFSTAYVLGAAGAIIVADATRPASVAHAEGLASSFETRLPGRPIQCVLNKSDLASDRAAIVRPADFPAIRTSARTGDGVAACFAAIAAAIHRRGL